MYGSHVQEDDRGLRAGSAVTQTGRSFRAPCLFIFILLNLMNSMPFRQLKSFLKILIGVQYKALSVTFGDSSPRGRAKGLHTLAREMERICTDTLHLLFYGHPSKAGRGLLSVKSFPQAAPRTHPGKAGPSRKWSRRSFRPSRWPGCMRRRCP